MSRKRKKKKSSGALVLVFVLLLVLLAALVALKFLGIGRAVPAEPSATPAAVETSPEATEVPAASPTPTPMQPVEAPVILENQGELEIIIPEDMESDGF